MQNTDSLQHNNDARLPCLTSLAASSYAQNDRMTGRQQLCYQEPTDNRCNKAQSEGHEVVQAVDRWQTASLEQVCQQCFLSLA